MRSLKLDRTFRLIGLFGVVALAAACSASDRSDEGTEGSGQQDKGAIGQEIQAALDALPSASVADRGPGGVPNFITGNLGAAVSGNGNAADVQNVLSAVAPAFRASADQLRLRTAVTDIQGGVHYRFTQFKNGREVIGGELIVHTNNGVAYAANGSARADLSAPADAKISAQAAVAKASGLAASYVNNLSASAAPELFYYRQDDRLDLVYKTQVKGTEANGTPIVDDVFVNAVDGSVVARHPRIHTAKNREVHNLNHGTSLPGPLARAEGGAANSDAVVNNNYDHLGTVYDVYKNDFGRDSFDGTGGKLISSVHYSNNYVNAFWNGTQMVYGDGDGVQASNLANSLDVTGHELTHAVTERTSNLTYSGQSGGLNEATSDIFGAYIEWVRDGRGTPKNETTWTVGDDVWTPSTPGDGLRYMYDPKKDGSSIDWAPDFANQDVHYTSGVPNLAFFLLSVGGKHPRDKSTVQVPGIGIEKAAKIFFTANTTIWTSSTNYAAAKTGTAQAAQQLYGAGSAEVDAVNKAWEAVGVGATTPPPTATEIFNNTPVSGISGASKSSKLYKITVPSGRSSFKVTTTGSSSGSGDADLYVKFGAAPTTSSYDKASESYTRNESVSFSGSAVKAGTWYILVYGYSSYSGVTLTAAY
ncbi:M4 family metallopeptidase [Pendulispora brunnea]|uniref:Neutral metalloproteinase n=1 Tax=Pendulispora brunnea TaxID=2905690 RepID=A0ABZ2K4Q4_9BACT